MKKFILILLIMPGLIFGSTATNTSKLTIPETIIQTDRRLIPFTGIKTIDPLGTGINNYTTLCEAINALNANGTGEGGVVFNIKDNAIFTENLPALTATGTLANPIIFQRDNSGTARPLLKSTGTSATNDGAVVILGGDYITFDGLDIATASGIALEFGFYLKQSGATNGVWHNTIKNSRICLTRSNSRTVGIYQYTETIPTSAEGSNSFNKYYNIVIENVCTGVKFMGRSSYYDSDNELNTINGGTFCIGGPNTGDIGYANTSAYGIFACYQNNLAICNTEIRNLSGISGGVTGISATDLKGNSYIGNNKIHGLSVSAALPGYTTQGIYTRANPNSSLTIYNNALYDIVRTNPESVTSVVACNGMDVTGGSSSLIDLMFNTIRIKGPSNMSSAALTLNSTASVFHLGNNILVNETINQSPTTQYYLLGLNAENLFLNGMSDYNLFYLSDPLRGIFIKTPDNSYSDLTDWRTAHNELDEHSLSGNPLFVNSQDYHITLLSPTLVEGNGSYLIGTQDYSWINKDLEGDLRSLQTPDIGADEGNFISTTFLDPPSVNITNTSNTVTLTWTAIPGASFYRIYSSSNPNASSWDLAGTTVDHFINFNISTNETKKFYRVKAVRE